MKKYLYLIIGVGIALGACEKVIDVDLNTANPNLVVESELFAGENDFTTKLSYTSSFFKIEEQAFVDNAVVSLIKEGADPELLTYADSGLYIIPDYIAEEGKDYTLSIDIDGINYSSTATMPQKATLDSLSQIFSEGMFGQEGGFLIFLHYKDDPNVPNYYRALYDLNGIPQRSREDVYILDDNFTDGSEITIPLFIRSFQEGDTVDVNFVNIDAKSYDYLLTLNTIIGNGQPSAAPANPNSNFSNGALGYFAIYNGDVERIVIGE